VRRRIFISDLDGTLLLPDKTLGPRTRDVLARFLTAGGLFTVATGRSAPVTAAILEGLRLPLEAIVNNGAMTLDLTSGAISHLEPLPGPVLQELFGRAREAGLCPLIYTVSDQGQVSLVHGEPHNRSTRRYLASLAGLMPLVAGPGPGLAHARGLSLLLLDEPRRLQAFFDRWCRGLSASLGQSAYTPGLGVGEVQALAADKAAAAQRLARRHGLGPERIVAFGDNANDLPLLRLAGRAYCPPDASPEVLEQVAGRIAPPAEEGVAQHLQQVLEQVRR
jgi:hydroxymethylpyrimidine pyrophosphatase-like HAD family hydrolase